MSHYSATYLGCSVDISEDQQLTVNGKRIDPQYDAQTRRWSSQYLPYATYPDLRTLAEAIVRDTEEFAQARRFTSSTEGNDHGN